MTPNEGFFREEALQHHTGARATGDLLRVPPSWTRWTFAFLVAVFVAAACYATLGSVTVYTRGVALARGTSSGAASVAVYFPERDRSRLTEGLVIRIENPSDPRHARLARLASVEPLPVPLTVALAQLGIETWPNAPPPLRLVVAGASLGNESSATLSVGEVLPAAAPIGKESLLALLLPSSRNVRED